MHEQRTRAVALRRAAHTIIAGMLSIGCRTDSPVAPAAPFESTTATASRQATTSSRILFVRQLEPFFHLFSMDDDGTNVRMLSSAFGAVSTAAWAPDGKRIVLSATMGSDVDLAIFTMNDDGTGITRLTNPPLDCDDHFPVALGKRIVFLRACPPDATVIVMNADGTGLTSLVDGTTGRIGASPRGDAIAYSKGGDLWLLDVSTGATTRLTNTPAFEFEPSFSPSGKRIAYSVNAAGTLSILTMNTDGTMITLVAPKAYTPMWSPDGKRLAFVHELISDISVMNIDGTSVTNLTQTPAPELPVAWTRY